MNWTEKYRPSSLKEVIGNKAAKEALLKWAKEWQEGKPSKKAAILYGKPGVGKTTSAYALARDFGWEVIELNASDERNREIIRKIALTGAIHEVLSIDGKYVTSKEGARKLIILDEADNLYEKQGDYGGKRAIVETIKVTKQPIILIANDYYSLIKGSGAELRNLCLSIEFKKVSSREIAALLKKICQKEGIVADPIVLNEIARRCDGDVRSAINDLQSIAYEKKITREMLSYLGYRDREREIFMGIRNILKAREMKAAIREAWRMDESPDNLILWIDENLPAEYKYPDDLARAYEFLSRADVFLGRVWRRQYYGLWSYATELMTGGVAVAKQHEYRGFTAYHFPAWLRGMAASKQYRNIRQSVAKKIGKIMHCSSKKALEMLPEIKKLFENDDVAARLAAIFGLSEEELQFLVGERAKEIYREAEKLRKMKEQAVLFNFK